MLGLACGRRREWLIAHGDETLPAAAAQQFAALVARRRQGEPLAYLLGEREFFSRPFRVGPAVLIPRPETEALAQWAIDHAPAGSRLLDLGTGSGALAITVALERPDLSVTATDLSAEALEIARHNAGTLGAQVTFYQGSWWDAIPAGLPRWATIISNPPYIRAGDAHLEQGDLRFEPDMALVAGRDGLDAIDQILARVDNHLLDGGSIAFEHGFDQAAAVTVRLADHGFIGLWTLTDDQGLDRLTGGQSPVAGSVV